jgi:hypothetical protein
MNEKVKSKFTATSCVCNLHRGRLVRRDQREWRPTGFELELDCAMENGRNFVNAARIKRVAFSQPDKSEQAARQKAMLLDAASHIL